MGRVTLLEIIEDGAQVVKTGELGLIGGRINEMSWTDDGDRIAACGEGSAGQRANCVIASSGNKVGDI